MLRAVMGEELCLGFPSQNWFFDSAGDHTIADGHVIGMGGMKATPLGNPVRNRSKTARDKIAMRVMSAHCLHKGTCACGQLGGRQN